MPILAQVLVAFAALAHVLFLAVGAATGLVLHA